MELSQLTKGGNVMNSELSITAILKEENTLVLSYEDAAQLGLNTRKKGFVSVGVLKRFVNIRIEDRREAGVFSLSQNIIDELHLPLYVSYEIRTAGNEIKLGPCIGILLSNVHEKITEKRLQQLLSYYKNYDALHGAVLVFALDGMKQESLTLHGYCYNPKNDTFEEGIFPYPSAIYRRTGIPEPWKNHLATILGDRIFNNDYFNKWEMHQWLAEYKEMKEHLPYTVLFHQGKDILPLLERYGGVYIKPITGGRAKGVIQLIQVHDIRYFKFREEGENQEILVTSEGELVSLVDQLYKLEEYILQEPVDLLRVGEQLLDFRVMMQKDQHLAWGCTGIIGRIGAAEGVISSISSEGRGVAFEECMREQFQKTPQEIYMLREKITTFALKVCHLLDKTGIHCGELGLDIGLDKAYKLWLLEVNSRELDVAMALNINDPMMYYKARTMPLYYCKALAGFEE